jgi:DNA-binding protein HU-beta
MKKAEAIEALAEKLGTTKTEAETTLKTVLNLISEAVVTGDKEFVVTGWGKFFAKDVPARQCRNPKTGDMIDVPAKQACKFKIGSKLKDAVNDNTALVL